MKRQANLINRITDTENLYFAFWKSSRGKPMKNEVQEYSENIDKNIEKLKHQILSLNLPIGNYTYFKIRDPKERIICAASFPERVLHHALMNVCHPYFERCFVAHTYATRPNKGTFKATDLACRYAYQYRWFAKLDVRKYFDSIDHSVLKQSLRTLFKDSHLLHIFDSIINSYQTTENKGLPIGNLTSQYFANFYLSAADHYAKETLRLPYLRYMDDMLFFANDKNELALSIQQFSNYLKQNLLLNLKPVVLNNTLHGVSFLGFKICSFYMHLNRASRKRFTEKYVQYTKNLETGKWSDSSYQEHILPLFSFAKHADTLKLRKKIIFATEG